MVREVGVGGGKEEEKENLPPTGPLLNCLQQPKLGEAAAKCPEHHPGLPLWVAGAQALVSLSAASWMYYQEAALEAE